jgi:hypothetical protein
MAQNTIKIIVVSGKAAKEIYAAEREKKGQGQGQRQGQGQGGSGGGKGGGGIMGRMASTFTPGNIGAAHVARQVVQAAKESANYYISGRTLTNGDSSYNDVLKAKMVGLNRATKAITSIFTLNAAGLLSVELEMQTDLRRLAYEQFKVDNDTNAKRARAGVQLLNGRR